MHTILLTLAVAAFFPFILIAAGLAIFLIAVLCMALPALFLGEPPAL
ncbi:MAG: hypothetical protein H0U74_16780 [Bradymonadaceae bacterium]|nr:hypothetical protein [Lujinxingiaceae bacterium]